MDQEIKTIEFMRELSAFVSTVNAPITSLLAIVPPGFSEFAGSAAGDGQHNLEQSADGKDVKKWEPPVFGKASYTISNDATTKKVKVVVGDPNGGAAKEEILEPGESTHACGVDIKVCMAEPGTATITFTVK
ncbi:MAG: hypothetical protein AAF570_01545 [Bacteroidota bacterium]